MFKGSQEVVTVAFLQLHMYQLPTAKEFSFCTECCEGTPAQLLQPRLQNYVLSHETQMGYCTSENTKETISLYCTSEIPCRINPDGVL